MASSDFPKIVVSQLSDHNGNGHWEARRKEDYNRRHAAQAAHATLQGTVQTGTSLAQINGNFNDFLRFCKLGGGKVDQILNKQGIDRPTDFDNYSFSELVDVGLSPGQVKAIKDARLKATGGPAGHSHAVYGADKFYNTSNMDVRNTARAPRTGRQDFVSMGRVDKQVMQTQVWGAGSKNLRHKNGVASSTFLAAQPGLEILQNSAEFSGVTSDLKQSQRGNAVL